MKEFRFIIKEGDKTTTIIEKFETYQEALAYGAKIHADEMLIPSKINASAEEAQNKAENRTIIVGIIILCVIWQIMNMITL